MTPLRIYGDLNRTIRRGEADGLQPEPSVYCNMQQALVVFLRIISVTKPWLLLCGVLVLCLINHDLVDEPRIS